MSGPGSECVVGDKGSMESGVVQPPFCPSEDVLLRMCDAGCIQEYLQLWSAYYDAVGKVGSASCVVEDVGSQAGSDLSGGGVPMSLDVGSDKSSTASSTDDVSVTSVPAVSEPVLPWRAGVLRTKVLSVDEVMQYGEGACYLHGIRADHASRAFAKLGGNSVTLEAFLDLPLSHYIPKDEMRYKAVTVVSRRVHLTGYSGTGWSLYTVLQAAVRAGMKSPLLEGVEPGIGDLRVDRSFIIGRMSESGVASEAPVVAKAVVKRGATRVAGLASWKFDDDTSTVVIEAAVDRACRLDGAVEKDANVLRLNLPRGSVELIFPGSLTGQVVSWELEGRVVRRLVVKVAGPLLGSWFFPNARRARVVSREFLPAVELVEPSKLESGSVLVVDTREHAKVVEEKYGVSVAVYVYGETIRRTRRMCYWPTVTDASERKLRLMALRAKAEGVMRFVGVSDASVLSGLTVSSCRYHRWYELQFKGAVSLARMSMVLVQSERGRKEAAELFSYEIAAGSIVLQECNRVLDTRGHVVCGYVESGAIMGSDMMRELWSGEADEYVCLSATEQPLDWYL